MRNTGLSWATLSLATLVSVGLPFTASADTLSMVTPCESVAGKRTQFVVTSAAAAAVTGLELQSMGRTNWQMAKEADRGAVLADPSSHLHSLGSYYLARAAAASIDLRECGDEETTRSARRSAALKGAAISLAIGTAKEVVDGWYGGFSTTDLAVDAIGASYAALQAFITPLEHITPSITMSPAALRTDKGLRGAAFDYEQQTLWLSANVHELLPDKASQFWPSAVRLSAGRRAGSGGVNNQVIVGLDLDAAALPGTHPVWMSVKRALHNVRLPGPAIVMGAGGTRTVGLYF